MTPDLGRMLYDALEASAPDAFLAPHGRNGVTTVDGYFDLQAVAEAFLRSGWQPIETAPKGGGAEMVTNPAWIEPPKILMHFEDGETAIVYWDWYYAEGGAGYDPTGSAWVVAFAGEPTHLHLGRPTHWRPLPAPPTDRSNGG